MQMTTIEINKTIHEAMGKCWHEWVVMSDEPMYKVCEKCSVLKEGHAYADTIIGQENPLYTSDWSAYGSMIEWAMEQEWWDKFAYNYHHDELLIPKEGSEDIAEFLKQMKGGIKK